MATYLPIRALNRSQAVRIGGQKVGVTSNTYIDIDDTTSRKEFNYHSSIGAVYTTGILTDNNGAYAIHGATVTATQATYTTGTVGVSGTTATGVGTTFTTGMVGGNLVVGSSVFQIVGYTSATVITVALVSGASTVATGAYTIVYYTTGTLTPATISGEVISRDAALRVYIAPKTLGAITAPGSGLSRRDLISVNALTGIVQTTTGTTTYTTGGTPNTVTTPTGDVPLAYVIATNGLTTLQVQDIRPVQ